MFLFQREILYNSSSGDKNELLHSWAQTVLFGSKASVSSLYRGFIITETPECPIIDFVLRGRLDRRQTSQNVIVQNPYPIIQYDVRRMCLIVIKRGFKTPNLSNNFVLSPSSRGTYINRLIC